MQHPKFATALLSFSMMFGGALFLSGCGGGADVGKDGGTFITEEEMQKELEEQSAARANYDPPPP